MRSSRALGILAGTAAVALATLTIASPASAATLPAGQRITIVDSIDEVGPQEGPFYDVDPADAATTAVGTGSGVYAYGLDVNDDGLGYLLGYEDGYRIWTADANTGTASDPKPLHFATDPDPYDCGDLDLNPATGELLVNCTWFTSETANVSTISTVDPATGLLTPIISLSGVNYIAFDAIALNSVTGVLWAFADVEGYGSYIIDRTLQTATFVSPMEDYTPAADFDRDGQLFLSTEQFDEEEGWEPSLAVADPSVGIFTFNENFADPAGELTFDAVYSLSVWGAPAPVLAETGLDSTGVVPVALGSALLLLAGAAAILLARRRRRA